MSWMDRVSAMVSRKSSRAGAAVAAIGLAPARWTPRRYDRLAEEGYRKNVVAYRCVREVARACASVPWLLYKGNRELDTHPLLDLLRRPNPRQSGPELIEAAIGHLLLSGNAYLEVVRPDGEAPREFYALRPDRMRIVPDVSGVPRAYRYEVEGRSVDWPVDPISGAADVLHLRDFHPLDDWYGLSPIEAAAAAIDQHNAAAEHNVALLQNGARPSGALVFRSDPGPDGIRRVEEALLDRTQGPKQAGRPLVLGGDVDWKELGFSPKDMDFAELKAQAAREIAAAFGVPHLLVVSGEATYSNRADARLELWEHTVTPLLDRVSSALSSWLGPMFGQDLRLSHDLDEVPALAPRRRLKWQQIQAADFLTLDEKRQALGYAPVEDDGEQEQKNSENFRRVHGYPQPRTPAGEGDGGRWTDGSTDFLRPTPTRILRPGGSGGARIPRRPGSGGGGRRGRGKDDDPKLPERNPFPERPDCVEQWARAAKDCQAEEDRILNDPSKQRNIDQFSFNYLRCLSARISEGCGGFPTGGTKGVNPGCPNGCTEMTSQGSGGDDMPLLEKASEYFVQGRHDDAIEACSRHIELNPSDVSGYFRRAMVYGFQQKFDEAVADMDEILRLKPGNPVALFHRGRELTYAGRHEEAVADFNAAETAAPHMNDESIALLRAHCLVRLRRFEEALLDIERIPDDGPPFAGQRDELLEWISRNR